MSLQNIIVWLEGSLEAEVVKVLNDRTSMFNVTHRCADLAELEAAVEAGAGSVVVTDAAFAGVDAALIDRLHAANVFVLLTCPNALDHLGVGEDAWCDRIAEDVAQALTTGLRRRMLGQEAPVETPVVEEGGPEGRVLVVWGTPGAPGRSTLALNLARQMADAGSPVTLIDADITAPSLLLMTGLPVEASGLAAAVALRNRGELDARALADLSSKIGPNLSLLTGLTRADRWRQLTTEAVSDVLRAARRNGDVVVDLSSGFTDEDPSLMSFVPSPEDINLGLARQADALVLVGRADAVGLMRLNALLGDCVEHNVPVTAMVLNQARDGACGSASRASLHTVMDTIGSAAPYVIVEHSPAVDEALLRGTTVIDCQPGDDFVASLDAVLEAAGWGWIKRAKPADSWVSKLRLDQLGARLKGAFATKQSTASGGGGGQSSQADPAMQKAEHEDSVANEDDGDTLAAASVSSAPEAPACGSVSCESSPCAQVASAFATCEPESCASSASEAESSAASPSANVSSAAPPATPSPESTTDFHRDQQGNQGGAFPRRADRHKRKRK